MALKASDIMTRKVVTVGPGEPVQAIARVLSAHNISAVPVCDETGNVIGVVSEGDLMQPFGSANMLKRAWWLDLLAEGNSLAPDFLDYINVDRRSARDLMTSPAVTASEDTPVAELADAMMSHRIKRLPIMRDGKLVGIASRSDIVRILANTAVKAARVA